MYDYIKVCAVAKAIIINFFFIKISFYPMPDAAFLK